MSQNDIVKYLLTKQNGL